MVEPRLEFPLRIAFVNCEIVTGSAATPWARGIELRGARVARMLSDSAAAPAGAQVVDLQGRALLPGIIDAHVHLLPWARRLHGLDLRECHGWPALRGALRGALPGLQPGEWLMAYGFHPASLEGEPARPELLEEVHPTLPILIRTHDTHGAWVSRSLLRLAGVGASTPDPEGGTLVRDASGEPTGMLLENGVRVVKHAIPPLTPERERALLLEGQREAHRLGIVGVHSFEGEDEWTRLCELRDSGTLRLRVQHMFPLTELDDTIAAGARTGQGDEWLQTGCVKLFADGTLGLRTARMLEPYASGGVGEWNIPPDELRRHAVRAARAGIGTAIHAIGDAGVRACLDALEAARAVAPVPLRIEHVQILSPEDLGRFRAAGITASMQPVHFLTDRELASREWGDRVRFAYAWGRALAAGADLVLGTDAPIEPLSPWPGLGAALGLGGPNSAGWDPARLLTLEQALEAMTRAPWRSMGLEGGTLEPGARADLIVLDRTAKELRDPEKAATARVDLTLIDGEVVHSSGAIPGFPATS